MPMTRKVIITCAVTGAIHTPSMSPHLPVTAEEIADAALGAAEAGAAIVHLHARHPEDGRPTQDPQYFKPFLQRIKAATNVVVNLTTGGAPTMLVEERVQPALVFKPEVASLNMGTMNFGLWEMLKRFNDLKHDWERPYLEGSYKSLFRNTYADIEYILQSCSNNGTPHAPDGRSAVRQRLRMVGARRRTQPDADADGDDVGGNGRQRARGSRRFAVERTRHARAIERRAGVAHPDDPGGAFAGDRHA